MSTPEEFLEETREQGLRELEDFLRIPSISSQPEHAGDVRRAAGHLAERYEQIGLENAEVIETANERLDLDSFYIGRKAALHLWEEIASIAAPAQGQPRGATAG